jgi:P4 family phage/plasmid primase-like protien
MPTKLDLFLNGEPDHPSESRRTGYVVQPGQNKQYTHQSFAEKAKMWYVPEDRMDTFRELYCKDLNNQVALYITEKSTTIGQLRIDLDIKFDGKVDEHKHTPEQVMAFMQAYMAEIKKYLVVNDTVEIFVLEKDYPTYDVTKKISASGIHVQIPGLKTRAGVEQAVRRSMLKNMEDFFPNLGFRNTWDEVYDKQPLTHTNMWMVLGSKKNEGLPYKIKYILDWDHETGEISMDDNVPLNVTPELMKKLSIRSTEAEETELTEYGKQNAPIRPEREVLPISGGRAVSAGRGRQATRDEQQPGSRGSSPGRTYIAPLSEALLKYYEAHVKNLAEFRYKNYPDWISVGQCLKNIHPDLEDIWLDFSAQIGDSYNPRESLTKWNSFGYRTAGEKLGVGTLRFWSRDDDLNGFLDAESKNVDRLLEESAQTSTEHDVARVVFAKYGDEFKCAKYGTNVWYQFDRHIWKETDKGIALQCRLSSDISKMYLEKEAAEVNNIRIAGDCPHKEPSPECPTCQAEKRKKAFSSMRLKLKTSRFKENVMKECRELFLDETLANKLDENKNLIAMRNGVFDTMGSDDKDENGNYIRPWFRDGRPDDYISFSTNIDYDPDRHYSSYECWNQIDKFMRDVLPDQTVRNYFVRHLSTCLSGGNEAQKFHILTGSGSNGKSMLMNLMSTAMGDYTCKAPISLLTQGRNKSAAAAPELVRMKGRRFVTMQEPDEEVPLNTGLMKELASCEKVTARDLYAGSKAMIDFDIQARFHLACNEKPKINATDGGTWRRLVVINFPSKFVADPKLANEKPIDESLVQKMVGTEWATCFLTHLIDVYKQGNGWRKITPPSKVMEYTSEYQEESDVIARFIREFVNPLEADGSGEEIVAITTQQMNMTFQEWKRSNEIHKGNPAELKKRVEAMYGKYPRSGWTSFRFGGA